MGNEQMRPSPAQTEGGGTAVESLASTEPRTAAVAAKAGRRYSAREVAELLRRASRMEKRQSPEEPSLTLEEVEAIARESGLDPAGVRAAAQALAESEGARGLSTRLAGAPVRRVIERVVEGEIGVEHHERLFADLRSSVIAPKGAVQVGAVGRMLTLATRTEEGPVEITLTPRDGKTFVRIEASCVTLAGALLGGGGFAGLAMSTAFPLALAANHELGVVAAVAAGLAGVLGSGALLRSLFSWRARARYRTMNRAADALAGRLAELLRH